MTARALLIGPGAARALAAGGPGIVELAVEAGGYVRLSNGAWLLLAPERAPLGPLSVLVRGLGRLEAGALVRGAEAGAPVDRAGVWPDEGAALEVGSLRVDLSGARIVRSTRAGRRRGAWRAALDAALAECPSPPVELEAGLVALRRGATRDAFDRLAGLGPGLTPSGDDVLAGYVAWRHADGAHVPVAALERCSPIGLAYVRCALRGELPDVAARVLEAVRAGDVRAAGARARALAGWGATSGTAMLWGMAAAAEGGA